MAFSKASCQSGKYRSIRIAAGALVYGRKKGGMVAPEKIAERYRQNDERILPRAAWGGLKVPRIGDIVSICKNESARIDRAAPGLAEKRCDLDRYGDVGHGIGRKIRKNPRIPNGGSICYRSLRLLPMRQKLQGR